MSNVPEVKYCPCGFTCYMRSWNFGYEFCPQCKVRLLPGGTTGPTYAELELQIVELGRRCEWFSNALYEALMMPFQAPAGTFGPTYAELEARVAELEQKEHMDLPTIIRAKVAARGPMDWSKIIGALSDLTDEEVKSLSEEKFDDTLAALCSMPADDLFNCPKCGADYHFFDEESVIETPSGDEVEFYCRACAAEFNITIHRRYMVEVNGMV